TTMLGTVPEGETVTPDQSTGYHGMSLQLPSTSSRVSWMNDALSSGVSTDMSANPAMASYSQLIARFPNQSNIFGPYQYA
ncbi:MAG TPA: hypothetical protein VMC61_06115, partial [Methanocella sp.]|nr:hypothetical protein [Methanocella sp.]